MAPTQTPRSDTLVGRIVGPYRVKARLRETGGVTTVIAEHLHLDRQVLLKWLTPASPAVLLRVKAQARALSRLKHHNILPVIDVGETVEGGIYLAFELGENAPLRSVIARRKALPWWEVRRLGRQIASAMRAAQAGSLPLAEVSPWAVFLAPADAGVRVDLATPELLGLCEPSLLADQVHGLGRVLYLMVTGHEPSANADQVPADPVLSWPELEIPADADALIMRALEPVPASRWANLEVLEQELGGSEVEEAVSGVVGRSRGGSTGARFSGARFSEPFRAPMGDHGSDDSAYADQSFGRRAFGKPSKRALISGGVAVAAGTVLLAGIVMSRRSSSTSAKNDGEPRSSGTLVAPAVGAGVASDPGAAEPAADAPAPTEAMRVGAAGARGTLSEAPLREADGSPPSSRGGGAPRPSVADSALAVPASVRAPAVGSTAPSMSGAAVPQARSAAAADGGSVGVAASDGSLAVAAPAAAPDAVALPGSFTVPTGAEGRQPEPFAAKPSVPGEACTVSLGSRPWSDVWFDGRRVGFTPLTNLAVPCGSHDVVLTSAALGVERRISLTLRPGEPLKRIVDLEAAPMAGPAQGGDGAASGIGAGVGCRLSLGSRPWSEVWVDGKRAGITPLMSMPVVCGKHDLLFLSRDANVEHRESIEVQNGQLLKRTVVLVEGD